MRRHWQVRRHWQTCGVDSPLTTLIAIACLAVAGWAISYLIAGRPNDGALRGAVLGLAALFTVLAVVGLIEVVGSDRPLPRLQLAAYLVLSPLIPVAAWWWARGDRARSGSAVLTIAALAMGVLLARITTLAGLGA